MSTRAERLAEARRKYAAKPENQAAKRAYSKQRYALHRELWFERDLVFTTQANVRARRLGIEGRLSRKDVAAIQGPCSYCGGPAREWDHVEPLTRGGANDVLNLVPCCRPCNLSKNNRTLLEWMLMKQRHKAIIAMLRRGIPEMEVATSVGVTRNNVHSVRLLAIKRGEMG